MPLRMRCGFRADPGAPRLAPEAGLHFLQNLDILLQTVNMLLHFPNRLTELYDRTQRSTRFAGFPEGLFSKLP